MEMVGFLCMMGVLVMSYIVTCHSWCPAPLNKASRQEFQQEATVFWEYEEASKRWVEISYPFDLMSCVNGNCTKVASIESPEKKQRDSTVEKQDSSKMDGHGKETEHNSEAVLPIRKGVSLTRMSEASVWVTGQSGSIYERFWNGLEWVIAPHELTVSAGRAFSVFIVNQTILSLSEAGMLYQLQLNENSQPLWKEFMLLPDTNIHTAETGHKPKMRIKSGRVSHDGERLYVSTTKGSLLEISEIQPLRWDNHGRPPGGDVLAIVDNGSIRPGVVYTVSSSGDLYELDKQYKPAWKKHIWSETSMEEISLAPSAGCVLHGIYGSHSRSLFLLTKDGFLVERRLHKRKWKWRVHGAPEGHYLSAITSAQQNDINSRTLSLFLTTTSGSVFEYQLPKNSEKSANQLDEIEGLWVNHMHPQHAKVARGIHGVQIQTGRIIFPLNDGRLGELHLTGIGGESSGPTNQLSLRRKTSNRYEWSILDAPESEGWNAEYCTEERGPLNCIAGMKDVLVNDEPNDPSITLSSRRRRPQEYHHYISVPTSENSAAESNNFTMKTIITNFRMRVMHPDRSFFYITDNGLTFEYLYTENVWLWLKHEQLTTMKGALGSYNGSLFFVDTHGSLLIRERSGNELLWINCTAMKKGRQVASGPPWDDIPGKAQRVTPEDALYFVNKKGRLLQFMVAHRKFKWKDCGNPPDTKIAFIVDQELFRMNIIFVVGRNGRLYQYNSVTELWHQHYQSPHLVLSRSPGTAMRPSPLSLTGSLFIISESGGLVEYNWNSLDEWEWVEHGTPYKDVTLVGAPGPSFDGTQVFVIGSDGHVYQRYLDQKSWKWRSCGYPQSNDGPLGGKRKAREVHECPTNDVSKFEKNHHHTNSLHGNCNEKVAPTRPIPFSEGSLIFELQDGRLAELRRAARNTEWEWVRVIGTPTSLCLTSYWTAVAT